MYRVYTASEVVEVETLEQAKDLVAAEYDPEAEADESGFVNPYIEDQDGNEIEYIPTVEEMDTWR